MSDPGAPDSGMGDLSGLSDRDVDRLLTGRLPADGNGRDGLSAFVAEVRGTYLHGPPEEVEEAHVAAAAGVARRLAEVTEPAYSPASLPTKPPSARKPTTRMRLALLGAGLTLAAALLGTVGLATADVALPHAVRAPFDAAGIALPNQGESSDVSPVVHLPLRHARPAHEQSQSGSGDKPDANGDRKQSHGKGQGAGGTARPGHRSSGHGSGRGRANSPHRGPAGQTGSTPTSPPGNSGSNPHGGPPGIIGTAPIGHGGKPDPGHGH